jgi:hypothetical protein
MEMLSLEASAQRQNTVAENHIDFKYKLRSRHHGPMCFDFGFGPSVGFVLQANRKIYKTDVPARYWKKWQKPIEIQQQMQEYSMDKAHKKIN